MDGLSILCRAGVALELRTVVVKDNIARLPELAGFIAPHIPFAIPLNIPDERTTMEPTIEKATANDVEPWAQLRQALWPHRTLAYHRADLSRAFLSGNGEAIAFIARNAKGEAVGFAEGTLRHDYVNGCSSSPVLFLEGIYVRPADRRQGVARMLCGAIAGWGKSLGCVEFGSDAPLENLASHRLHAALGFEETQRVVFFRKPL